MPIRAKISYVRAMLQVSKLGGTTFGKGVSFQSRASISASSSVSLVLGADAPLVALSPKCRGTAIPLRENNTVLLRSTLPTSCARTFVIATTSSCSEESVNVVVAPLRLVIISRTGTGLAQVKMAGSGMRMSTAMNGAVGVVAPETVSVVFLEPPKNEAILDLLEAAVGVVGRFTLN